LGGLEGEKGVWKGSLLEALERLGKLASQSSMEGLSRLFLITGACLSKWKLWSRSFIDKMQVEA
jgi:hypothetical protein